MTYLGLRGEGSLGVSGEWVVGGGKWLAGLGILFWGFW